MANTALNRTTVSLLTNKSGASVAQGDVVVVDSANATAFTTSTTSGYISGSVGVVLEPNGIASNATGAVAFAGYVPIVNLSSSASLGDVFKTHSVAKQAVRHAAPVVAGDFGQVLGTGTTPAAFLWGQPAQVSSGGSSTLAADTDVSVSTPATNQSLVYDGSAWANQTGFRRRFFQTTVGVGGVASVSIPSIPSGYSKLVIEVDGRGDAAATVVNLTMQVNGDTGSNYDTQTLAGSASGSTAGEQLATTAMVIGGLAAASAPAGFGSATRVEIFNYAGTTFQKNTFGQTWFRTSTSSGGLSIQIRGCAWRSTSAATSVLLAPSSGNFAQGTLITAYLEA